MPSTLALPYTRPMPPGHMRSTGLGFARAEGVEELIYRHFLDRDGLFFDPEHGHLTDARIGVVWAQSTHTDKGSEKAGAMQLLRIGGEPRTWADAVQRIHLHSLFGDVLPEFKMTLSAPVCWGYDDRQFFALVDHELLHGDVKRMYGAPVFNDAGRPVWATRPHDHEGFAGTVERWGAAASGAGALVEAGAKPARFAWVPGTDLDVHRACGTR
jgi:putative metallopeptidase